MADTKLADLTALTTPSGDDILYIVDDPAGTPLDRKIALNNLFTRGTITADAPVINASQTWNNGAVTFTGLKFNATDTASAAASLLLDIGTGGGTYVSKASVTKDGAVLASGGSLSAPGFSFKNETNTGFTWIGAGDVRLSLAGSGAYRFQAATFHITSDASRLQIGTNLFLSRRDAANLRLGNADAAAPVAQTLSVQSGTAGASATTVSISGTALTIAGTVTGTIAIGHAVTGTGVSAGTLITAGSGTSWTVNNSQTVGPITAYFNSVGQNLTLTGSQGSGPSAGGSIIFQVAPAGSAATTAQNALQNALLIDHEGQATFTVKNTGGTPTLQIAKSGSTSIQVTTTATFSIGSSASSLTLNANAGSSPIYAAGSYLNIGTSANNDVQLYRDAANTLALRNGGTSGSPVPQTFNIYNWIDGANYERGFMRWNSNRLEIGLEKGGTGTLRDLEIKAGGTLIAKFAGGNGVAYFGSAASTYFGSAGDLVLNSSNYVYFTSRGLIDSSANGVIHIQNFDKNDSVDQVLALGPATSSSNGVRLKRDVTTTTVQIRNGNNTAFASVQGKLTTDTTYQAGDPATTGYLVVYDSTGTAYKIPALAVA